MTLTDDQIRAAEKGQQIRFTQNGVEFVVIRSKVFEALVEADHEELRAILALSSEGNGWDHPGMEAYDSYPANS